MAREGEMMTELIPTSTLPSSRSEKLLSLLTVMVSKGEVVVVDDEFVGDDE